MTTFSFKTYQLEISLFLCLIVPPVGVFLLLFNGWFSLHQIWKQRKRVELTPGLFLLGCMFVSSICASITMNNYSFFLVSALILAYIGLYAKILNNSLKILTVFKWATIFGGIYCYCIYPFQKFLMAKPVLGYLTGTALIGPVRIDLQHYTRLIGSTYNPNFTVALLLLGISFLFADCLDSLRRAAYLKLALQFAAAGMFTHAILLTGSKAGFAIMLIIFIFFLFRWNKWISIVLITLMGMNIPLIIKWMPRSEELLVSAEIRKEIWKRSFYLWQEHSLFGTTPIGFYKEYFYYFNEHVPHAHNMILGIFTEYGSLGGIAFLLVIFINLYKVIYLYLSNSKEKVYLNVFLLSLPVVLLTGVFDYVLYSPQVALLAIILLASWDKYTAKVSLVNPRLRSFMKEWISNHSFRTSQNNKSAKNSLEKRS